MDYCKQNTNIMKAIKSSLAFTRIIIVSPSFVVLNLKLLFSSSELRTWRDIDQN